MKLQEAKTMLSDEELELLQQDILEWYGYDFTEYSKASFKRRIERLYGMNNATKFTEFRKQLQEDRDYFYHALTEISVNVTEMFRDAGFYKTIREQVIPALASHSHIRIWHAGCASGEEVYSMAILLHEAGLLRNSLIYGTDINPRAIEKARKGIFPIPYMQQYSRNYQECGGTGDFSSYYTANYGMAKFKDELSEKMIFSTHNLVSDASFNAFQMILCRNVLIYFERKLQAKVISLFDNSLELSGFLALGTKESIRFSPVEANYKQVSGREKIWRKIK